MKNRILLVHNFYQVGGGEHTVFKNEMWMLKDNGHFVYSYTRDNNEIKSNPIKLILTPLSTIFSFKTYFEIKKIIKEQKIDIVHCHNTFPLISPAVYYAAWSAKIPVVQTVHNFRLVCANGLLYREGKICENCLEGKNDAIKYSCYRNSKIQTLSVVLMQKIHKILGTYKKLNYIFLTEFNKNKMLPKLDCKGYVAVKPNFVEQGKVLEDIEVDLNKFIFVGRLDEYKGVDFLLDFFSTHGEYKLVIYGEGKLEGKCTEFAKKYQNIIFKGFKEYSEMQNDWQSSCAMIFASKLYEGMPMTIIESFLQGVPVICTDIGNAATIVMDGDNGYHFTLGDKDSLLKGIQKLQNNQKIISENLIIEAKKYSMQENYKHIMDIYEKISN